MRKVVRAGFAAALLAVAAVGAAQDAPPVPVPQKEHQWLQQFVGEWTAEGQAFMAPGQPPVKVTGTESVRALGGLWIVAESKSRMMEMPFTGLLTLGYDAEKKKFVGTWVDSVSGYLWTYEGTLDPTGKVLTLETEGPCPQAPGRLSRFREVLEAKGKDYKRF